MITDDQVERVARAIYQGYLRWWTEQAEIRLVGPVRDIPWEGLGRLGQESYRACARAAIEAIGSSPMAAWYDTDPPRDLDPNRMGTL